MPVSVGEPETRARVRSLLPIQTAGKGCRLEPVGGATRWISGTAAFRQRRVELQEQVLKLIQSRLMSAGTFFELFCVVNGTEVQKSSQSRIAGRKHSKGKDLGKVNGELGELLRFLHGDPPASSKPAGVAKVVTARLVWLS
jgi:hypothetical protein